MLSSLDVLHDSSCRGLLALNPLNCLPLIHSISEGFKVNVKEVREIFVNGGRIQRVLSTKEKQSEEAHEGGRG